jgi:hypothetical protein
VSARRLWIGVIGVCRISSRRRLILLSPEDTAPTTRPASRALRRTHRDRCERRHRDDARRDGGDVRGPRRRSIGWTGGSRKRRGSPGHCPGTRAVVSASAGVNPTLAPCGSWRSRPASG